MNPESLNNANKSENPESTKWDILTKYDADERARVDRAKEQLWGGEEKIEFKAPSTLKKMGRSALDFVGLKIPAVERKRNDEALAIAIKERNEEQAAIEKRLAEEKAREAENKELKNISSKLEDFADSIKREEEEKVNLARDMVKARDYIEEQQYEVSRAQEIIERTINESLVKIDDLEGLASGEYEGVKKDSTEYGEKTIPVYSLKGYPCDMLISSLAYKTNKHGNRSLGEDLAEKVIEDPSVWAKNKGEIEGGSLTICASYIDLSVRPDAFVKKSPMYGFSKIRPNSVLQFTNGDGHSAASRFEPVADNVIYTAENGIPMEASDNPLLWYNELTLKRYSDDDGKPLLPDYIVVVNGQITDIDKKHAAYWGIPIVNIEEKYYEKDNDEEKSPAA